MKQKIGQKSEAIISFIILIYSYLLRYLRHGKAVIYCQQLGLDGCPCCCFPSQAGGAVPQMDKGYSADARAGKGMAQYQLARLQAAGGMGR